MENSEKKQVSVKAVVTLLEEGRTRPQIREEFGLTHAQMKKLFAHEKLKGRRSHSSKSGLEIIDDLEEGEETEGDGQSESETVVEPTPVDAAPISAPVTAEMPTTPLEPIAEVEAAPIPVQATETVEVDDDWGVIPAEEVVDENPPFDRVSN